MAAANKTTLTTLFQGIRKLIANGIPTPLGKPDERKMRRSKAAKRVFFISISRPVEEGTQEKVYELIANTYRCSRIAIASVPGKKFDTSYFYVLIELHPALNWSNAHCLLESKIEKKEFVLVQLFSFSKGLTHILSTDQNPYFFNAPRGCWKYKSERASMLS